MKKQKHSWLTYCLGIIMAIGLISAMVGCVDDPASVPLPPSDTTYTVTISSAITNGTVTAEPKEDVAARTTITVTATPDEGYRLKSLKQGTTDISVTLNSETNVSTGTFRMPSRNVTISAEFVDTAFVRPDYGQYSDELLAIIADMSTDEKIGQMTQAERQWLGYETEETYANSVKNSFLGSVLNGGGSGPGPFPRVGRGGDYPNTAPADWWDFTNRLLLASMENPPKGSMTHGIPYVYGIDAVHGHANAMQNPTVFPHNIGMGAVYVGDPAQGIEGAYEAGRVTAIEMYATGHRFNFNPVLGVGESSAWGRMYESYSENPDVVSAMGSNYVRGLQWNNTVGACGKHYGFEGQVSTGASSGNAAVGDIKSDANLRMIWPYKTAIDAGLLSVMMFYGQVNGTAPIRHKDLMDILKVDWGFEGFIITDWSQMGTERAGIVNSVNAGVDMNMAASNGEWTNFISQMKTAVNNGEITEERLDDAVYRILLFKKVFGILDDPVVPVSDPFPNGSDEHREIARDIAAKTLVLLKNKDDVVGQLSTSKNILVTGTGSQHVGYQCGGWTRQWQGMTSATIQDFQATTIYEGLQKVVPNANIRRDAAGATVANFTPDVVIAVVSETPYSEGSGDRSAPAIGTTTNAAGVAADATMLTNVRTNYPGVPIILIVISGRPVSLAIGANNYAEICDGIIAAWLPGSEAGDAIADVLFGAKDFVGKTPMTWRTAPVSGDIVFPFGWGLKKGQTDTYNADTWVPPVMPSYYQ